eukprot:126014-Prorocentrum_minimum.AAC.1
MGGLGPHGGFVEAETTRTLQFGVSAAEVRTTCVMNVESAPEVASAAAEIEEVEHKMEDLMAAEEDPVTLQAATEERDDLKERLKVQQRAAKIQIEYTVQYTAECGPVQHSIEHGAAPHRTLAPHPEPLDSPCALSSLASRLPTPLAIQSRLPPHLKAFA